MTNDQDTSGLSALERMEAADAEAGRFVSRWAREWRAEGYAEGHAEGYAEGSKEVLDTVRKEIFEEVSSEFGLETAEKLEARLEPISDLDLLVEIYRQIRGGMTGPELLAWIDART